MMRNKQRKRGILQTLSEVSINTSLSLASLPTGLKSASIVTVLKSPTVTGLNDYLPKALASIVVKYFKRIAMTHIKDQHHCRKTSVCLQEEPITADSIFYQSSPTRRAEVPTSICSSWISSHPSTSSFQRP